MKGSQLVSSSAKMGWDDNGKRVVTTVTKTTVMESKGKRMMETTTKERKMDNGGRVKTQKVVQTDGDRVKDANSGKRREGGAGNRQENVVNHGPCPSPFRPLAAAPSQFMSPVEVAVIATDNFLGFSVSDSVTSDPDRALPQSNTSCSGKIRWCRDGA